MPNQGMLANVDTLTPTPLASAVRTRTRAWVSFPTTLQPPSATKTVTNAPCDNRLAHPDIDLHPHNRRETRCRPTDTISEQQSHT